MNWLHSPNAKLIDRVIFHYSSTIMFIITLSYWVFQKTLEEWEVYYIYIVFFCGLENGVLCLYVGGREISWSINKRDSHSWCVHIFEAYEYSSSIEWSIWRFTCENLDGWWFPIDLEAMAKPSFLSRMKLCISSHFLIWHNKWHVSLGCYAEEKGEVMA